MSSAALQSSSPFASELPSALRTELAHADCLARAVESLLSVESPSEPAFVWLLGRAEEIRAYVGELTHEWSQGRIDTGPACEAMATYLAGLHATLEQWYGRWYYPSCCGPYSQVHEHGAENIGRVEPSSEVRRAAAPRMWSQLAVTQTATVPAIELDEPTVKIKLVRPSAVDAHEATGERRIEAAPTAEVAEAGAASDAPAKEPANDVGSATGAPEDVAKTQDEATPPEHVIHKSDVVPRGDALGEAPPSDAAVLNSALARALALN